MKHLSTAIISGLLLIAAFGCQFGYEEADADDHRLLGDLARRYVECTSQGDFACAASLFHYPPDTIVDEEVASVAEGLAILVKHSGTIRELSPVAEPDTYLTVSYGSGDLSYWREHPASLKGEYQASFTNWGNGYLVIEAVDIADGWELRSVHYGLSNRDPRAMSRITEVLEQLHAKIGGR